MSASTKPTKRAKQPNQSFKSLKLLCGIFDLKLYLIVIYSYFYIHIITYCLNLLFLSSICIQFSLRESLSRSLFLCNRLLPRNMFLVLGDINVATDEAIVSKKEDLAFLLPNPFCSKKRCSGSDLDCLNL